MVAMTSVHWPLQPVFEENSSCLTRSAF